MASRHLTDEEREAVIVRIEVVAANLTRQVADLQRFVTMLRPQATPFVVPARPDGKDPSG